MKLLFDHNLSPKLATRLSDLYPGSNHVTRLDSYELEDPDIRSFAAVNGFIVVTKDADYSEMHSLFGAPPKIIWIRHGNCSTAAIETILRDHVEECSETGTRRKFRHTDAFLNLRLILIFEMGFFQADVGNKKSQ